ncbi:Na(+) H(+) antiporter subunit A [Arcticibacter svalbardensis MN12-7]|uniref:Na(+) H(+) antiporter subunit A n=1 Tax=Arcticibacter svalbardensis MN12-7 TaxID=1150600 RepID=R9GP12_9SPHI|nr:putative monovalent cation/H+ antiporter subunit A [Arcticibacter svalbardensis]EOR93572.1 Na(+) H(+) antiporter subunit A [Arcticibacter svalbardensis MN12-7]
MLFTVLSGLITSGLFIPFGKYFRTKWGAVIAILPILLFCYLLQFIPVISTGITLYESYEWVPSLHINFDLRLDGLSLLFSLLITGIGSLIFIYASSYLKGHSYLDRFYGYLCLFMASMLGIVLSDNIILLFVFWELTSISSFFLIGFNNDHADSRKSAITALSVTGLGGFFLLAGLILMGSIAGTYSIGQLIESASIIKNHELYPIVLGLVFIGAFTKSAQFPFHFWLPDAMKAPTPVSAYLHSATMVKAGIFLLARFTPILGGTSAWSYTLMIVGGFTMIYAALHSLFRTDLKAVLAYSTISALGILTFLIGIGTQEALIAAITFTVVHALYKATLFLTTGIIDHETETRDLSKLSGLRKVLFPVFIAGTLAALSSAGMPLLFGFISKDLIYEATLHSEQHLALYLTIAAVLTNVCLVAAGFMAGIKPFLGNLPQQYEKVHLPDQSMWIPPLILALLGLAFGLFPAVAGYFIVSPAVTSMSAETVNAHLQVWHGFNTVLLLSLVTLALGSILFLYNKPDSRKLTLLVPLNKVSPQNITKKLFKKFVNFSAWYTNIMHNGFLRSYLLKIIIFAEALLAYELFIGGSIYIDYTQLSPISIYEAVNVLILIAAVGLTVTTSSRLTAVVGTSAIGYAICLMFVYYSAPDLAMTQFTIDTLTVVLFVFVLFNLPSFINQANNKIIIRDSIVAITFGTLLSIIAIKVLQVPTDITISEFYGQFAYTLAKGKNVVNVILVDFRGLDTMFEIVVLSIAALGVYSLIRLKLKSSEKD